MEERRVSGESGHMGKTERKLSTRTSSSHAKSPLCIDLSNYTLVKGSSRINIISNCMFWHRNKVQQTMV